MSCTAALLCTTTIHAALSCRRRHECHVREERAAEHALLPLGLIERSLVELGLLRLLLPLPPLAARRIRKLLIRGRGVILAVVFLPSTTFQTRSARTSCATHGNTCTSCICVRAVTRASFTAHMGQPLKFCLA